MRKWMALVIGALLLLSSVGCQSRGASQSVQPAGESALSSAPPMVTADPMAPNDARDEAQAIQAISRMLQARGDDPEALNIVRASTGDETIPTQWWSDHDSGKPYKVIVLWARAGYQGHPNWQFLLWKTNEDAPWELVSEGKS